jgi:hypothetical protein
MQRKEPQNTSKHFWTNHVKAKMRQYGLSEQRIKRVIKSPLRVEIGVAQDTVAVMQPQSTRRGADGGKTWTNEIWVMYQIGKRKSQTAITGASAELQKILSGKQIRIISAWRYPGQTKEGESLPAEIWDEIQEVI